VPVGRPGRGSIVVPFLLPAFGVYTLLFVGPAVWALWVSLHNWSGFGKNMVYVGLGNYMEMRRDPIFWGALGRTVLIAVAGGIGVFGLAMFFSAVFQQKIAGKRFFRSLIFFPVVVPGVGIGLIWQFIYNNDWGLLSNLLKLFGLGALDTVWLGPSNVILSLTAAIVWTYVGYYMVILSAGIDRIPLTHFEAARIDGASQWQQFFYITLPMIWEVVVVALILWAIGSLKIFDIIVATVFPAPQPSTYTLTVYIWTEAFGGYTPAFRLGYGTAMGVVLLVLVLLAYGLIRLLTRRDDIEY
jgi:ABC-type sugar transport system permease subunit